MITINQELYSKMPDDIKACFNQLPNPSSEEVRGCFPETKKGSVSGYNWEESGQGDVPITNASRFFKSILYYPKASKSERNKGCEGLYILKDGTPEDIKKEIEVLLDNKSF